MVRQVLTGALIGVLGLSGCGLLAGDAGLSRDEAERIAIAQAPGTVDDVISARQTTLADAVGPNANPGPARDTLVWAIVLRGTFPPASCGPVRADGQPPVCPPDQHTALVVLDSATGDFIMASVPADAR